MDLGLSKIGGYVDLGLFKTKGAKYNSLKICWYEKTVNKFTCSLLLLKTSLISNTGEWGGSSIQTYIRMRKIL